MNFSFILLTLALVKAWEPDCKDCTDDDFVDGGLNLLQVAASKKTAQRATAVAATKAVETAAADSIATAAAKSAMAGTTSTTTSGDILIDSKFPLCAVVVWVVSLMFLGLAMACLPCQGGNYYQKTV